MGENQFIGRKLDDYIKIQKTKKRLLYCSTKDYKFKPTIHILFEINPIPLGKYYLAHVCVFSDPIACFSEFVSDIILGIMYMQYKIILFYFIFIYK